LPQEIGLNDVTPRENIMPFTDIPLVGTTVFSVDFGKVMREVYK